MQIAHIGLPSLVTILPLRKANFICKIFMQHVSSTRNYVVVLGDLNARVGDGEVEGVVGKYGVPGENESGERSLDMCVEQELVIGNSFFKKKGINKYTWIRVANGRVIERALMDYVLITKRMVGRLKDVHVFRGVAVGMSDHFLVEAEVVVVT